MGLSAFALCVVFLMATSAANAQEADVSDAEERALALFSEAETSYEAGRVDESLRLLLEAQALYSAPVLQFNIARAYETLGQVEEALEGYRAFLRADPGADDRGAIERRIAALEEQIAERERLERERRIAAEQAAENEAALAAANRNVSPVAWVLGATGVATLGAGVVMGVLSRSARQEAIDNPEHAAAMQAFDRGQDLALAANILFSVGGVLTAAGTTWIVVHLVRRNRAGDVRVSLSPTYAGLEIDLH